MTDMGCKIEPFNLRNERLLLKNHSHMCASCKSLSLAQTEMKATLMTTGFIKRSEREKLPTAGLLSATRRFYSCVVLRDAIPRVACQVSQGIKVIRKKTKKEKDGDKMDDGEKSSDGEDEDDADKPESEPEELSKEEKVTLASFACRHTEQNLECFSPERGDCSAAQGTPARSVSTTTHSRERARTKHTHAHRPARAHTQAHTFPHHLSR